jgi:MSHA pilin protein MshA
MEKRKNILTNNQGGFTLIEIIAVLVILGILSAVAVPKYMDLQNQARIQAADAAIAEVKSRLSTGYGIYLLKQSGTEPTTIAQICGANGVNDANTLPINGIGSVPMGNDYTVAISGGATTTATITVSQVQGTNTTIPAANWAIP